MGALNRSILAPVIGLLLVAPTQALAADEEKVISIFESDDLILVNPVESTTVLMAILLFASVFEMVFEALKRRPEKFFHTVFESIIEESMLVGILAMILIFVQSAGTLSGTWKTMINNSVLVLLFMVVTFAGLAVGTIFWTLRVLKGTRKFERSRMEVDPLLSPSEQLFKDSKGFFRASLRMHGLTDTAYDDILFSDYVQERCAETIANIYDLSWKSWGVLALFVAGNIIRTRSVVSSDEQDTNSAIALNISTFVAIMGVFPVALHYILHTTIRLRLVSLTKNQNPTNEETNVDSSHLLFFSSLDVTAAVFSAIILLLEWYVAMFFLNMANKAFTQFGPVAVLVVIAALVPPLAFIYLLPWTVMNITILCSVGRITDKHLATMLKDAAVHGIEFALLATHVPGEDLATAMAAGHVIRKVKKTVTLADQDASLDPQLGSRLPDGKRTTSNTIRGNVLAVDDEWDIELTTNLRGSPSDDEEGGDGDKSKESKREASGSGDDDDSDEADAPLTYAILDKNYLNDRESVHFTSRQARDAALEREMKEKAEKRQAQTRGWDSLRPMYLPDWRHNPILAREEEIRERRAALEAEKERLAHGQAFEL